MNEEDEAFNEIERQAKQRKEAVKAAINKEKPMNETPSAFPWTNGDWTCTGMTLRDYFAAKAMQAFLRNEKPQNTDEPPSTWAEDAYVFADAMMKAREA
jgi:hypothetical protein